MSKITSRLLFVATGLGLVFATVRLSAQDQTVNGNLDVTGTLDVSGNQINFGTQSGSFGAGFFYVDASNDTLVIHLNRSAASWAWKHNTDVSAMKLDSGHNLLLYNADGTAVGLSLNPVTKTISFGDVSLYRSASGMLRTDGGITVDGTFNSSSLTANTGAITGGASGLALNAGGTDQSVTITPSGTGALNLGSGSAVTFAGDIRPHAHNTHDLGLTDRRWRSLFVAGTTATGSLTVDSGDISGGTGDLSLAGLNVKIMIDGVEAARFAANGSLLLGTTSAGSNGRLQLAAHTTSAGGIGFGSDTNLYRSAAGTLKTDGKLFVSGNARFDGAVRIAPQGDLSMGEFTNEP